jgi:hypothetical protein
MLSQKGPAAAKNRRGGEVGGRVHVPVTPEFLFDSPFLDMSS